jgi:hypothetical protein
MKPGRARFWKPFGDTCDAALQVSDWTRADHLLDETAAEVV